MPALFADDASPSVTGVPDLSGSLFVGAQVLTGGGTLSQAANAVLTNAIPPNGSVAEPAIVEAGSRGGQTEPAVSKHERNKMVYWIGGLAALGVIWWIVSAK